jgi:plasmid maintenance system antidote protein VapI
MESTTFTALAERAGRWWTVRVPQFDGLAVQVRSIDQAEIMARQRIAEALHVPPESIRVEVRTDSSILPAVAAALQARQAAVHAAETAARATRAAIEELLAEGTSFQEAAVLLGLSPEEIAQLTAGPRSAGPRGPGGAPGPAPAPAAGAQRAPSASSPRATPQAERPVGPSGLPMRTRSSGPMAVHH